MRRGRRCLEPRWRLLRGRHKRGIALRGTDVYVYGGGSSARQAAKYLSRFADSVTIVIRGTDLSNSLSADLIEQIADILIILVRAPTVIKATHGEACLERLTLESVESKKVETGDAIARFIFIGSRPLQIVPGQSRF
jgi:thioredoxin reductase (NADPH)